MPGIALITPHYHPAVRGNAVTVRRIERNLRLAGCQVQTYALDAMAAEEMLAAASHASPDLIHAFHGYLGGRVARQIARRLHIPYIVTLTGTDVYEALEDIRKEEMGQVLKEAARITVFHTSVQSRLLAHFPSLDEKTVLVPQGVDLPEMNRQQGLYPFPPGSAAFFLPAGLRPVKHVLFPLEPLRALHQSYPELRLYLAGPVLNRTYAAEVLATLEGYPFAHYLGEVNHDAMDALYQAAAVVLNTSLFEGGMANSVLEALAWAKPVLAADIEGNRSLIKDGESGLLYGDEVEFLRKAEQLLASPALGNILGKAGRQLVQEQFPTGKEASAYIGVYEAVIRGGWTRELE